MWWFGSNPLLYLSSSKTRKFSSKMSTNVDASAKLVDDDYVDTNDLLNSTIETDDIDVDLTNLIRNQSNDSLVEKSSSKEDELLDESQMDNDNTIDDIDLPIAPPPVPSSTSIKTTPLANLSRCDSHSSLEQDERVDPLDKQQLNDLVDWFNQIEILPSCSKTYCLKLYEFGIATKSRLAVKLDKDPSFLMDQIHAKAADIDVIVDNLRK